MIRQVFFFLALVTAQPAAGCEIRVSAAASLSDLLREVSAAFERESNCDTIFNFGASSTLARQIERGAPSDLFVSADRAKVTFLSAKKLIDDSTIHAIATNDLVIVTPRDRPLQLRSPADLLSPRIRRIALARPDTVPAGIYARTYLERHSLWQPLQPKITPTDNVRAALAAAAVGEVEAAFVYATDVRHARGVTLAFRVPRGETADITYFAAIVAAASNRSSAERFLSYLRSGDARKVFARHGFGVVK